MKRIVLLIDGTWNYEGGGGDTNVALLDQGYARAPPPLISAADGAGVAQVTHYNAGVGAGGSGLAHWLGGALGLGLKDIVGDSYVALCDLYESGDEVFTLGFSRGSYAARALAAVIGASGIAKQAHRANFERAWAHYRVPPAQRTSAAGGAAVVAQKKAVAAGEIHDARDVKAVAVFDTVGSYGVPAGIGLAPLARVFAYLTLGFHDTEIGSNVAVALHALALDEHRRAFVPTFWTAPEGEPPAAHVEQTWFAGAHSNVGGGLADPRLSNLALVWMACRLQALTGLAFDAAALKASAAKASVAGAVEDSTAGVWWLDHWLPKLRRVLGRWAYDETMFREIERPGFVNVAERVHWSVLDKVARDGTYRPKNLPENPPATTPPERIAAKTTEEIAAGL